MRQQLEKSLYDAKSVKKDLIVYQVGDLESLSASVLYTNEKIVDLKSLGIQMHFHEDKNGNITGAGLKKYGEEKSFKKLSNYEATMGDAYAVGLGLPRIKSGSS